MSVGDIVIETVFGCWAAASIAVQVRLAPVSKLRKLDYLQLLPVWKLFAPDPTTIDYRISYRAWDHAGTEAIPWTYFRVPRDRSAHDMVLNTQRRARKALRFSAKYVMRNRRGQSSSRLVKTPSYRLLLGVAKQEAAQNPAASTVQFRIERVRGYHLLPSTLSRYESKRHST